MSPYTYTYAYTRAEALVDQVDALFREAGIDEKWRTKVCKGVSERWLEAVGLYLERDGKRVYEIEAAISWSTADSPELSFSTDLPGWEQNDSPEAVVFGKHFAGTAAAEKLVPEYWVRFIKSIRDDPPRHEQLCVEVGVGFGTHPPDWLKTPETKSVSLQDLGEMRLAERSALRG